MRGSRRSPPWRGGKRTWQACCLVAAREGVRAHGVSVQAAAPIRWLCRHLPPLSREKDHRLLPVAFQSGA